MKINKKGLSIIKQFEGCRLTAYKDPVGIPTIGYGHTAGVHDKRMNVFHNQTRTTNKFL